MEQGTVNTKLIDKVKKLFALANDNPNENEAMLAMLKAQEFMAQHNISDLDLERHGVRTKSKEVHREFVTQLDQMSWWMEKLARVIADNFRCFHVKCNMGNNKARMEYTGLKEDVELASRVLNFAVYSIVYNSELYMSQRKRIAKRNGEQLDVKAVKNDFMLGFINGLRDKFNEQVERNNWGLILVKDEAVIEAHKSRTDLKQSKARSIPTSGDGHARESGYKAGNSFKSQAGYLE